MKKFLALTLAGASALSLAACGTPHGDRVAGGALLGAAGGAIIGSAVSGGRAGGALAGAAIGAASGAVVADATAPRYGYGYRRCASWDYNYYGRRVCTSYY
jgi:hypothetical protein